MNTTQLLDMELLSRLGSLEVQARYLVEGYLSGRHRSPQRGQNVEFREYRAYQLGDEPRTIDWKVLARTDRVNVKLREEDTNFTAYILLDASASMKYRSEAAVMSKWQYARSVAAALLLLFQQQQDAGSLGIIGRGLDKYIAPSLKGSEYQRMMAALHRDADTPESGLLPAIAELTQLIRRRSLMFVISDFYESPEALNEPLKHLRYRHCEPIFMHVMDPRELDFDFDAPVYLEDLETSNRIPASPDLLRGKYLQRLKAHCDALESLVQKHGGHYVLLPTNVAPVEGLGMYLARRKGEL